MRRSHLGPSASSPLGSPPRGIPISPRHAPLCPRPICPRHVPLIAIAKPALGQHPWRRQQREDGHKNRELLHGRVDSSIWESVEAFRDDIIALFGVGWRDQIPCSSVERMPGSVEPSSVEPCVEQIPWCSVEHAWVDGRTWLDSSRSMHSSITTAGSHAERRRVQCRRSRRGCDEKHSTWNLSRALHIEHQHQHVCACNKEEGTT